MTKEIIKTVPKEVIKTVSEEKIVESRFSKSTTEKLAILLNLYQSLCKLKPLIYRFEAPT